MINKETGQWNFEKASPLTRVVTAHFEQQMANPILSRTQLVDSIFIAFENVPFADAIILSKKDLSEILSYARPGQAERSAMELAVLSKGDERMVELAMNISELEATGDIKKSSVDFSFLAAYALGQMAVPAHAELIEA